MLSTVIMISQIIGILALVCLCMIFPYLLRISFEEALKVWNEIEKKLKQNNKGD